MTTDATSEQRSGLDGAQRSVWHPCGAQAVYTPALDCVGDYKRQARVDNPRVNPNPYLVLTLLQTLTQFRERLELLVSRGAGHPKLAALVEALRRHFGGDADCGAGEDPAAIGGGGSDGVCGGEKDDMGRAIVFTNLRESVATIVDTLALHAPLIKPRCVASLREASRRAPKVFRCQQTPLDHHRR